MTRNIQIHSSLWLELYKDSIMLLTNQIKENLPKMRFTCFLFSETEGTFLTQTPPILYIRIQRSSTSHSLGLQQDKVKSMESRLKAKERKRGCSKKKWCWKKEKVGKKRGQERGARGAGREGDYGVSFSSGRPWFVPAGLSSESFPPRLTFIPGPEIPPLGVSPFCRHDLVAHFTGAGPVWFPVWRPLMLLKPKVRRWSWAV